MWFTRLTVTSLRRNFVFNSVFQIEKSPFHTCGIKYVSNTTNQKYIKPDLKPIKSQTRKATPIQKRISPQSFKPLTTSGKKGNISTSKNLSQKSSTNNAPLSKKPKPTTESLRVEFTEAKPEKKLVDLSSVIFTKNPYFVQSAPKHTDFKLKTLPEVAFVGRSNVGKSSIINALANRNRLVKTSKTPGHTKLLNIFSMADKLILVDMPGYGYRSWDEWGTMSMDYFRESTRLRRIFVLIEATHGFKDKDRDLMSLLDGMGVSYQVMLTKIDKLSKTALAQIRIDIETELSQSTISCFPQVLPVSAGKKLGIVELRCAILEACRINTA